MRPSSTSGTWVLRGRRKRELYTPCRGVALTALKLWQPTSVSGVQPVNPCSLQGLGVRVGNKDATCTPRAELVLTSASGVRALLPIFPRVNWEPAAHGLLTHPTGGGTLGLLEDWQQKFSPLVL